ncbi:DNA internalization-related competence protein ComEC/Rec2 [Radiobacillus deserti]|nr:DNA internalization-related competence protein ComEC/Rec2 [Radiobacillus deserti]
MFLLWMAWVSYKNSYLRFYLWICMLLSLGLFSWMNSSSITPQSSVNSSHTTIHGEIISIKERNDSMYSFVIEEDRLRTLVTIFNENQKVKSARLVTIKHGAFCKIKGKKEIPERSRNPGQFDYQRYLQQDGISFQLTNPSYLECKGASFYENIYTLRERAILYTERYSSFTASWLQALLLGNDDALPDDTVELFRRWGLSHLLAISGLHVGLLIGMIYFFLIKICQITKEHTQVCLLLLLPIYACIAGAEPSIIRASCMAIFVILLQRFQVKLPTSDVLSIVFVFLIMFNPSIIRNVGFQFSFLVTFAILLSLKWLKSASTVVIILRISLVAQLSVLPLQAFHFYSFNPLSILLNTFVVPYFSFIVMPFVVLLFILSVIAPWIGNILQYLFVKLHGSFLDWLDIMDSVAYFPWVTGKLSVVFVVLLFCSVLLMMKAQLMNQYKRSFYGGCLLVLLLTIHSIIPYVSPKGSVTMLDIGQGDCFVIELPYRKGVILIDAAGKRTVKDEWSDTTYRQVIMPFLHYKGIQSIDAIILSHNDLDHVGSVPFLVEHFNVKSIWTSPYFKPQSSLKNGLQIQKIQVQHVKKGEVFVIQGQSFYTLHPKQNHGEKNRNSLVLFLKLGGLEWLFTGDIGVEEEKMILKEYPKLQTDVLKVAHHGSQTSTSEQWIKQIKPKKAMVSVGKDNRYGHPSRDVIELLNKYDIPILRTDLNGAITYEFVKEKGTFFKHLP